MAAALVGERREEAVVLDVAAGTGLVGEELHKRGFKHIHAHDGALNMIETCKQKGIYSNFIHCLIGEGKQIPTADDTYDVLAMSGGTCENHLPPSAQQEFVRVIKPGGFRLHCLHVLTHVPTVNRVGQVELSEFSLLRFRQDRQTDEEIFCERLQIDHAYHRVWQIVGGRSWKTGGRRKMEVLWQADVPEVQFVFRRVCRHLPSTEILVFEVNSRITFM
ncbi:uncharacterized protein LOC131939419 isoform X3 [Physella acuta]|nr:uncharacterized protein LOC131939419 isoform X3 [Physella acuta]